MRKKGAYRENYPLQNVSASVRNHLTNIMQLRSTNEMIPMKSGVWKHSNHKWDKTSVIILFGSMNRSVTFCKSGLTCHKDIPSSESSLWSLSFTLFTTGPLLIYFRSMLSFSTPCIRSSHMFSGVIDKEHWPEMG